MDNSEQTNFLIQLKDNLLLMKDLINKKIEQQENFLSNKDGRLEEILKTAQANILINELRKENNLTQEELKAKAEEISKITQDIKDKIK